MAPTWPEVLKNGSHWWYSLVAQNVECQRERPIATLGEANQFF